MRDLSELVSTSPARRRALPPRILALVTLLAACGAEARAGGAWTATVDTIGDTIVVRTVAGRVWTGDAVLVPEVSIGVLEGEDAYMLGQVAALAVAPAGEIYVMDSQVPVLRKYGPGGRHIADIGRSGGGPGEYERPDGGLAVLSDGRVLVRDPGNARINVFSADGDALGEWRHPGGGGFSTSTKMYTDTADNSYVLVLLESRVPVTEWRYGLARMSAQGVLTDTLPGPVWSYERPIVSGRSENSSSSSPVPFTAQPDWAFSPLGYFVGSPGTEYAIEYLRANEPRLRVERAFEPVRVGDGEKADAEERITNSFRRRFPGWRWNGPPIPGTKPPFRSLFAGQDGRVWVLLSQPSVEVVTLADAQAEERRTGRRPARYRESVAFDVFEPDGRYLGRVDAPAGFSTSPEPVFRGDRVWAVSRDSLDVASVVRYRLEFRGR